MDSLLSVHPHTHTHTHTPTTLALAVRAREEALAARVDEPFERREGSHGELVDMRPLALKIKVAEREYSFYVRSSLLS